MFVLLVSGSAVAAEKASSDGRKAPFLTAKDYVAFLREEAAADACNFYYEKMDDIVRTGLPGCYDYSLIAEEKETASISYVSAADAVRYGEWFDQGEDLLSSASDCDPELRSNRILFSFENYALGGGLTQKSAGGCLEWLQKGCLGVLTVVGVGEGVRRGAVEQRGEVEHADSALAINQPVSLEGFQNIARRVEGSSGRKLDESSIGDDYLPGAHLTIVSGKIMTTADACLRGLASPSGDSIVDAFEKELGEHRVHLDSEKARATGLTPAMILQTFDRMAMLKHNFGKFKLADWTPFLKKQRTKLGYLTIKEREKLNNLQTKMEQLLPVEERFLLSVSHHEEVLEGYKWCHELRDLFTNDFLNNSKNIRQGSEGALDRFLLPFVVLRKAMLRQADPSNTGFQSQDFDAALDLADYRMNALQAKEQVEIDRWNAVVASQEQLINYRDIAMDSQKQIRDSQQQLQSIPQPHWRTFPTHDDQRAERAKIESLANTIVTWRDTAVEEQTIHASEKARVARERSSSSTERVTGELSSQIADAYQKALEAIRGKDADIAEDWEATAPTLEKIKTIITTPALPATAYQVPWWNLFSACTGESIAKKEEAARHAGQEYLSLYAKAVEAEKAIVPTERPACEEETEENALLTWGKQDTLLTWKKQIAIAWKEAAKAQKNIFECRCDALDDHEARSNVLLTRAIKKQESIVGSAQSLVEALQKTEEAKQRASGCDDNSTPSRIARTWQYIAANRKTILDRTPTDDGHLFYGKVMDKLLVKYMTLLQELQETEQKIEETEGNSVVDFNLKVLKERQEAAAEAQKSFIDDYEDLEEEDSEITYFQKWSLWSRSYWYLWR